MTSNGLPSLPTRSWRKKTGPGRRALDQQRDDPEHRGEQHEPDRGPDLVHGALDGVRGARQAEAPHAEHADAVELVELDGGAHDLEQARQDRDLDADGLRGADAVEGLVVGAVAGRDDGAMHTEVLDDLRELGHRPHGAHLRLRVSVERDAPHHPRVDRRVLHELVGDALGLERPAEHEHALHRRQATGDPAGGPAARDRGHEEDEPQPDELAGSETALDELRLRQHEQQDVERRGLEELGRLVERGLVEQQRVAVVQALDLGDDHHERQRERDLPAQDVVADPLDRQHERQSRAEQVRDRQEASVDGFAASEVPRRARFVDPPGVRGQQGARDGRHEPPRQAASRPRRRGRRGGLLLGRHRQGNEQISENLVVRRQTWSMGVRVRTCHAPLSGAITLPAFRPSPSRSRSSLLSGSSPLSSFTRSSR